MNTPQNLLTEWTRLFIGALVRGGLEDLVVSPGARSTPALLAAHATEGLRLHPVRDERAAGFFALGLARATGRPCGLLCTSGTAPGHYLPAVMEARADGLPLIVLTADRPPELHGIAAPQTVDQVRLFGAHAVDFVDLGVPDEHPKALDGLVRKAAQALHVAQYPAPGAVQVDLRARKPLEPVRDPVGEGARALRDDVDRRLSSSQPTAFRPACAPDPAGIEALAAALAEAKRPLVVAGPRRRAPGGPAVTDDFVEAAFSVAARLGAPLLAEAASQLRLQDPPGGVLRVDGYDRLLLSPAARAALAPDLVVQLGGPPTSAPLLRALAEWPAPRWIVAERGWPDVDNRARGILLGPVAQTLQGLESELSPAPVGFAARWRDADALAWRVDDGADWGEGAAVRGALDATPEGAALMLGNSLPIRHVETYVRGEGRGAPEVIVQRGVNGIDGLVAGAAGWVTATGRSMTLVLGDVSLLHDATSLELTQDLPASLVIVVLDNRGGRIFERLGVRAVAGEAMAHFVTPPQVKIEALAGALGARAETAVDAETLEEAVRGAHRAPGGTLVRVVVPEHGAAEALTALQRAVDKAWARRGQA